MILYTQSFSETKYGCLLQFCWWCDIFSFVWFFLEPPPDHYYSLGDTESKRFALVVISQERSKECQQNAPGVSYLLTEVLNTNGLQKKIYKWACWFLTAEVLHKLYTFRLMACQECCLFFSLQWLKGCILWLNLVSTRELRLFHDI